MAAALLGLLPLVQEAAAAGVADAASEVQSCASMAYADWAARSVCDVVVVVAAVAVVVVVWAECDASAAWASCYVVVVAAAVVVVVAVSWGSDAWPAGTWP